MSKRILTEEQKEKARQRSRAWHAANRDRALERKRVWAVENKEKRAAKARNYYSKNKEKIIEKNQAYYVNNKEKMGEWHKQYEAVNKEKRKAWRVANRERKRELQNNRRLKMGGELPKGIVQKLMKLQKGLCINCKTDLEKSGHHLDHIEPISKGGKNVESNVQLLCPPCNHRKFNKDPIAWANENGRLL
jgi:5-methylcytosine-specific restriction endonuclease McrA